MTHRCATSGNARQPNFFLADQITTARLNLCLARGGLDVGHEASTAASIYDLARACMFAATAGVVLVALEIWKSVWHLTRKHSVSLWTIQRRYLRIEGVQSSTHSMVWGARPHMLHIFTHVYTYIHIYALFFSGLFPLSQADMP